MKKILIVGDIHFGKSSQSTTRPGLTRQASSEAGEVFKSLVPRFKKINPDLMICMGDSIRDVDIKEIDKDNFIKINSLLDSAELPMINLLGNHELLAFSKEEIKKNEENAGRQFEPFGLRDLGTVQIMWLDFEIDDSGLSFITKERLEWIKNSVVSGKPLLVFSHYSMVPIDLTGNFLFEDSPENVFFKNSDEIGAIFDDLPAKIFINAHTHFLSHKQIDEKHFISNPAFSENIAAEKYKDNNPGVYSILEIDKGKFVFSSYSGKFCFAKIEGNI